MSSAAASDFSGSWVELHDARGVVLYARNISGGLKCPLAESFGAGGPEVHPLPAPSKQAGSTIEVLVPNREDAATLVWFDHTTCPDGRGEPLGAFELR